MTLTKYQRYYRKHKAERTKRDKEHLMKRKALLLERLGACVMCGATENIEVDHIDSGLPKKFKSIYNFSKASDENIKEEWERCQPLCKACHKKKSLAENIAKQALWEELTPEERERRVTAAKASM